eukprot:RCo015140
MRLLSPTMGRAVEVLLTVGVLAFVAHDLCTPSSSSPGPTSRETVLSFEEVSDRPAERKPSSRSSPRAAVQVTNVNSSFIVCGDTVAPTNPWAIGNSTVNQALVVQLGGGCLSNPAILQFNSSTNVSLVNDIAVASGSWLSFQSVTTSNGGSAGATCGGLSMAPGSFLETVFSASLKPVPSISVVYPLLLASGACPSFTGVNVLPPSNCPTDSTLTMVGSYACVVSSTLVSIGGSPFCNLFVTIVGALSMSSSQVTIQFSKDCSTFTPAMFKGAVFTATGVPVAAINILTWACGSIATTFTVLGSDPA